MSKFCEQAQDLNGSGLNWGQNHLEKDGDIFLFFKEREEDNRYIKGGNFSHFGTIYCIDKYFFKSRIGEPDQNNILCFFKNIELLCKKVMSLPEREKVFMPSKIYISLIDTLSSMGKIARLDRGTEQRHKIITERGVGHSSKLVMGEHESFFHFEYFS